MHETTKTDAELIRELKYKLNAREELTDQLYKNYETLGKFIESQANVMKIILDRLDSLQKTEELLMRTIEALLKDQGDSWKLGDWED